MSVDRLQPSVAMFLRLCSFMHHDGISGEIFKACFVAISSSDDDSAAPPALADFLGGFHASSGH